MPFQLKELQALPVFGIAGNFADHLNQAGEASDFVNVKTEDQLAPKGIFPIYIPGDSSFLGVYPFCNLVIRADFSQPIKLQAEPEISVLFELDYDGKQVSQARARAFSAFNDCSLRWPAAKISQKKNWGAASTGLSEQWLEIDQFSAGGVLDHYHLCCFIKRDHQVYEYGVDSPVLSYSYFYQKLADWVVKTLNQQKEAGPLEDLPVLLAQMNYPKQIIITLGATRYTDFGESHFLQPGDQVGVFVYDPQKVTLEQIRQDFSQDNDFSDFSGSALVQTIEAS
ncbi:MAG: hypothetical protein IBX48_05320 [Thiomicrospira sp.]|uniref:DUF5718 family protein n=1 Tax=Thiomicrospira sp. TaxID=935 RepID=UPI0019E5B6A6|nr:DUF5718 family protein [Thiomicrospira sp.]MBE0493743.1 hypothetical protein [Thiomicrospira sp.]